VTGPTLEAWGRVKALFAAALEQPPPRRATFLAEACGADKQLQAEVEELLAAHARADGFLEDGPAGAGGRGLQAGERIGPYQIVALLGQGGMGKVYRARDTRLGREVAIKIVSGVTRSEEALRRFELEARAAAAINHPNILALYDVGSAEGGPYLVSELLEGELLRSRLPGPLPLPESLDLATQLAGGLRAAHRRGVVHRDLKPENLFITSEGRLKILDFGIAKLVDEGPGAHSTQAGAILGTIGYMSPEQVEGLPVDGRSDLFSFGAILYEMLSGRRAFFKSTPTATSYAIVSEEPAALPAATPPWLAALVGRCLRKRREDRFQTAQDLLDALGGPTEEAKAAGNARGPRAVRRAAPLLGLGLLVVALGLLFAVARWRSQTVAPATPPVARAPSIAVLPFVDMSPQKDQEYLADGLAEEILNALAQVDGLRVTSRTSSFAFRNRGEDLRAIGRKLNVATVLEGSVRKSGTRVRITAQIINAVDGYHLWSNTYDRELENIFAVEDEISLAIVQALTDRLVLPETRLVTPSTKSLAAHDLYLRGRYFWNQRTPQGLDQARASFEQAIALDPAYALAYVGLADSYAVSLDFGSASGKELLPRARRAVLKALELDGRLAEAHASLGMIESHDYEWNAAEAQLRLAIALKPDYAAAHHWLALLLLSTGRTAAALAESQRALQLEPTSLIINNLLIMTLSAARDYDRAVGQAGLTLALEPGFKTARLWLARAELARGNAAAAVADMEAMGPLAQMPDYVASVLGHCYAAAGRRTEARAVLAELEARAATGYVASATRAIVYAGLGDRDHAFAWLDKAYDERDWVLRELKAYPLFDGLRSDPRFAALLRRMKLE
jgi:eukaryotic-like serine/threonine-protein kinase